MSSKIDTNQLGLFPSTNDIARATRKSQDEKEWDRERSRRSKRKRIKPNPMPATGPCCGRCHYWVAPLADEGYGSCRTRVVTSKRMQTASGVIEQGICLAIDPLTQDLEIGPGRPLVPLFGEVIEYQHQHCGPAWSCSGYTEAAEMEVAA